MMKTGIFYDFPLTTEAEAERWYWANKRPTSTNGDRVRRFAKRHDFPAVRMGTRGNEFVRVWFGDDYETAVRARDRYHALSGGHYALSEKRSEK